MDPKLIERLKQQYSQRRPTVTFPLGNDGYLGDGTFSITFAALDGRVPCVVKFSKRPWAADQGVAKERQALLDLMLQCNGHPHVVALHYFDDVEGHLATQWERGELSLEQRLQACRADGLPGIPLDELLPYMEQAANGLDFVNGKGIVHRDVKPENLLLFQGQVKLIDFGFARLAEIDSVTNSVHGTPVYAPPEASDKRLNPSVDIYCLAGTFIRLRTGEYPFGTGNDLKTRKQAAQFHTSGLMPHEVEVLRGALYHDPKRREYAAAAEFIESLALQPPSIVKRESSGKRTLPAPAVPARRGCFLDKIRGIVAAEYASLREDFEWLLHEQLDAEDFALAYGTVNCLMRAEPKNAEYLKVRQFLEQTNSSDHVRAEDPAGIRFSLIPPGEFLMGSPFHEEGRDTDEFQHRVRITQPYYMGVHPVTVGHFKRFVYAKGYMRGRKLGWTSLGFNQRESEPVVNVSYTEAVEFTEWLAKITGKSYGLPTEAQWEYACRAGTTTPYWFGNNIDPKIANFNSSHRGMVPVETFPANPFGLFDMHGNVWQWCAESYDGDYYHESPFEDPSIPVDGSSCVLRGGGWDVVPSHCRAAYRKPSDPFTVGSNIGFRVVVRVSPRPSRPS